MLVKIKQKSRSRRWYGNAGAQSNAGKSKQNPDYEDGIATLELSGEHTASVKVATRSLIPFLFLGGSQLEC
jgi:hypothetical protein